MGDVHRALGVESSKPCMDKMVLQLERRIGRKIAGIECPGSSALFLFAVEDRESGQTQEFFAHVNKCAECSRDVRQMKTKLPNFERLRDRSVWGLT